MTDPDPDYTRALIASIRRAQFRRGTVTRDAIATDGANEVYCQRCGRLTSGGPYCPACQRDMRQECEDAERWGRG